MEGCGWREGGARRGGERGGGSVWEEGTQDSWVGVGWREERRARGRGESGGRCEREVRERGYFWESAKDVKTERSSSYFHIPIRAFERP